MAKRQTLRGCFCCEKQNPSACILTCVFLSVGLFLTQALLTNKKGRQKDSSCYPRWMCLSPSQSRAPSFFYTSRTYFQSQEALSVEVNPEQTEVSMGRFESRVAVIRIKGSSAYTHAPASWHLAVATQYRKWLNECNDLRWDRPLPCPGPMRYATILRVPWNRNRSLVLHGIEQQIR